MAETTILAAGTSAATGTDVTVAAGATVILCLFVASGGISESAWVDMLIDTTAGADVKLLTLNGANPAQVFTNNTAMTLTLRARRPAQADSVGVIALA
jgi:hypothetical protein